MTGGGHTAAWLPPGSAGRPEGRRFTGACGVVSGGQSVKAAGGEAELRRSLGGTACVLPECVEHMADEGGRVTMDELLILFKDVKRSRRTWPHHPSFRRASLRSPSSKRGGAAKKIPALLTTKLLLLCSPRDRAVFVKSRPPRPVSGEQRCLDTAKCCVLQMSNHHYQWFYALPQMRLSG